MMVGKVFTLDGERIFQHSARHDSWHQKTASPGGLDAILVEWLVAQGINSVHHLDTDTGKVYTTTVGRFVTSKNRTVSGGRDRIFVMGPYWKPHRGLWYVIPHIPESKRVVLGTKEWAIKLWRGA